MLIEVMLNKPCRNYVNFLPIQITSKKVCQNEADFSVIKFTTKKVHQNDTDFSPIEITSKKYFKIMWKFVDIFFTTYLCNIDIKSTSIRRVVSRA